SKTESYCLEDALN
nr:McrB 33 kda polypeptide [Escherichia coli, K-12, Peptide Partial, 13 aa] [Escherichia coli]